MRATKATVRLGAIGHNLKAAMQLVHQSRVLPVIKANAYGHGAIEIARKLETFRSTDVPAFAVAIMEEAVQLRQAGIVRPLLVLQGSQQVSDVAEAAASNIWLMVHNTDQIDHIKRASVKLPLRVWLKVDTGMHRLGLDVEQLDAAIEALDNSGKVQPSMVLCSHLASADDLENSQTERQIEQLKSLAEQNKLHWSIANSAGIMGWPQSHADWVRPGYMLYGNSPVPFDIRTEGPVDEIRLQPAMTLTSEIISIRQVAAGETVGYGGSWVAEKPATIGVVAIGYADGYPRHAVSGTPVWLNGQRLPLAGRVSMDMIAVDLSDASGVLIGDEVELWGQNLSVNEVAAHAGTIGYEILAGLTGRVPIQYLP